MTEKHTLNIIEKYHETLIGFIVKVLKKNGVIYNGIDNKGLFIENFWKLYTEKKIGKKGAYIFEDSVIEYNFHGSGCFFNNGNIEIDSNFYNQNNQFSINFGVHILWHFIEKNRLLKKSDSREVLSENLEKLCNENKISRSFLPPFQMYYSNFEGFILGNSGI